MLPWRRHRRTQPALDAHAQADTWQLCSLLLDYPDEQLAAIRQRCTSRRKAQKAGRSNVYLTGSMVGHSPR